MRRRSIFDRGIIGVWVSVGALKLQGLSFSQKAIVSLVAEFNKNGAMLSNADWAEILGVSDRQVRRLLADLEEKGLLRKTAGEKEHRVLRITPDIMSTLTPPTPDKMSGLEGERRTKCPKGADVHVHHKQKRNKRIKKGASGVDPAFGEFWKAYPRRVSKQQAQKAWQKLKPDQGLMDTILAALEKHKQTEQWQKDGGKFIPHPNTWLNQERWEDEVETPEKRTERQLLSQFPPMKIPTAEEAEALLNEC